MHRYFWNWVRKS